MILTLDGLLLLAALLCVLQFALAVSYRFRDNPAKEAVAHLAASAMVLIFTTTSRQLDKPEFEVFGIIMIVIMAIYFNVRIVELAIKISERQSAS